MIQKTSLYVFIGSRGVKLATPKSFSYKDYFRLTALKKQKTKEVFLFTYFSLLNCLKKTLVKQPGSGSKLLPETAIRLAKKFIQVLFSITSNILWKTQMNIWSTQ